VNSGGTVPYVVEQLSGKLVGLRGGEFRTVSEWSGLADSLGKVAVKIGTSIVLCADYRRLQVLGEDVAGAVLASFRQFNSKLERSAVLLPAKAPILRLQMERMIKDAKHDGRRICLDGAEAKAWLSSSLSGAQQLRLDEFLAFPVTSNIWAK
jgi:hypothetical protein